MVTFLIILKSIENFSSPFRRKKKSGEISIPSLQEPNSVVSTNPTTFIAGNPGAIYLSALISFFGGNSSVYAVLNEKDESRSLI